MASPARKTDQRNEEVAGSGSRSLMDKLAELSKFEIELRQARYYDYKKLQALMFDLSESSEISREESDSLLKQWKSGLTEEDNKFFNCLERKLRLPNKVQLPMLTYTGAASKNAEEASGLQSSSVEDITALTKAIVTNVQNRLVFEQLPKFNGRIKDWLSFKVSFVNSAKYFTGRENVARLREAVRGKARAAVSGILYSDASADDIFRTLEQRFGGDNNVARYELQNMKSLPPLTDSPRDIMIFAMKIQNSVRTITYLRKEAYLNNFELIDNLVGKLTPELKYRWHDFAHDCKEEEPDAVKFSRFMEREAELCD